MGLAPVSFSWVLYAELSTDAFIFLATTTLIFFLFVTSICFCSNLYTNLKVNSDESRFLLAVCLI